MLQSGSKILYHHVDYGRDHYHWSHRKKKLWYTPRNPLPWFLCLELLHLSSLRLTALPTPTLFVVFAFHRQLPFITGVRTPSIRCFYNSSLSILACIGKVFACCLHQEHKRLPVVQLLHIVFALSFIWEHFFFLHLLSHYSTSLDLTSTPAQSPCALVQFMFSRFSLFLAYVWQQLILL